MAATSRDAADEFVTSSGAAAQVTPSSSRAVTPNRSRSRSASTGDTLKASDVNACNESILAEARRRLRPTASSATGDKNVLVSPTSCLSEGGGTSSREIMTPDVVSTSSNPTSSTVTKSGGTESAVGPCKTVYAADSEKIPTSTSTTSTAASTPASTPEKSEAQKHRLSICGEGCEQLQRQPPPHHQTDATSSAATPSSPLRARVERSKVERQSSMRSLVNKWTSPRPPLIDQSSSRSSNFSALSSSASTALRSAMSSENEESAHSSNFGSGTSGDKEGLSKKEYVAGFVQSREFSRSSSVPVRNQSLSPRRAGTIPLRKSASMPRPLEIPSSSESGDDLLDEPEDTASSSRSEKQSTPSNRHTPRSPLRSTPSRRLRASPRYQRFLARSDAATKPRPKPGKESGNLTTGAHAGDEKQPDESMAVVGSDEVELMEPYSIRRLEDELDRVVAEASMNQVKGLSSSQLQGKTQKHQQESGLSDSIPRDGIPNLPKVSSCSSTDSIAQEIREGAGRPSNLLANRPVTPVGGAASGESSGDRESRYPSVDESTGAQAASSGADAVVDASSSEFDVMANSPVEYYGEDDVISEEESISDDVTVKQGNTASFIVSRREAAAAAAATATAHSSNSRSMRRPRDVDGNMTPKRSHVSSAFSSSPGRRSPVDISSSGRNGVNHSHEHLLEAENIRLRDELAKLSMDIGIKNAIIVDLKQRLNDLRPDEGQRVEAESLQRMRKKQKDFTPIPRRRANQSETDRRFLC